MIWIVIALLSLIAAAMLVRPLVAAQNDNVAQSSSLAVYKSQLSEVDSDLQRGLIAATEAEAARLEIKRRILALGSAATIAAPPAASVPLVVVAAGAFAVFSIGLYLYLGQPMLAGHPYALVEEQEAVADATSSEIEGMISKLEQHLKAEPDDVEGWRALGWAQMQIGRSRAGAEALKKAASLAPLNASMQAMYGEALVREAEGDVTDEAIEVFERVLQIAPQDPRARFYKGLYLSQHDQGKAGLDLWIEVIRNSPADAEWLPSIRQQAKELALKLKLDPASIP